jgi:2-polyprenyl-6-methoxyphenol hydroxylase-like FAD-dependent oxidoreductase
MTQRSVIVVGAGVGGLCAAWWLARIGWRVTVLERAPDLRTDGYVIGLSGPGYEVAQRMSILPDLKTRGRDVDENVYLDRQGREVLRLRYREFLRKLDWIGLVRTELVGVLYGLAKDVATIRFGVTVTDFVNRPDGVTALLSDGSQLQADLLIGADGVHSATRQRLFGVDQNVYQPLGYRVAAFQAPDTLGLGRDFISYVEPGRMGEFYSIGEGRLATLYIWRCPDTDIVSVDRKPGVLAEAFRGAHPDAVRWIMEKAEDEPLFLDTMLMVDLPRWSDGRVVLLGDAAHCLTLLSGQGAGMAMTSACMLAEELAKGDIDAALLRHEERLRPAIRRLQIRSRNMAAWFIPATKRAFHLRNVIMRWLPRWVLGWYFLQSAKSVLKDCGVPLEKVVPATAR